MPGGEHAGQLEYFDELTSPGGAVAVGPIDPPTQLDVGGEPSGAQHSIERVAVRCDPSGFIRSERGVRRTRPCRELTQRQPSLVSGRTDQAVRLHPLSVARWYLFRYQRPTNDQMDWPANWAL